jgi:hypothetical protein
MITVGEAKQIAKDWVEAEAPNIPNFHGAFLNGSILWKKNDEPLPLTSDVDIAILVDIDNPKLLNEQGLTQQYRSYKGIILETTFSPFREFGTPDRILANHYYTSNFTLPNILSDRSGQLTKIQKTVAEQYTQKKWVTKRIEGARDSALLSLESIKSGAFVDRMVSLSSAILEITFIPMLADLRPPTVRKCVMVFLEMMESIGRQDLYESLLKIYGSQSMTRIDVERHLEDLSKTFDRTLEIVQSSSLWDYINPIVRPVVISANWEMINDEYHREAMWWIYCMRTICQHTILQDASEEEQKKYAEQYEKLLAELGLRSEDDFQKRGEDGALLLDEVMQVALEIVETNPKIIQ